MVSYILKVTHQHRREQQLVHTLMQLATDSLLSPGKTLSIRFASLH
jgi:hypothetical protein